LNQSGWGSRGWKWFNPSKQWKGQQKRVDCLKGEELAPSRPGDTDRGTPDVKGSRKRLPGVGETCHSKLATAKVKMEK